MDYELRLDDLLKSLTDLEVDIDQLTITEKYDIIYSIKDDAYNKIYHLNERGENGDHMLNDEKANALALELYESLKELKPYLDFRYQVFQKKK